MPKKEDSTQHTTQTFFEISFIKPIAYGDYFLNEPYDLESGVQFGIAHQINNISLHFDLGVHFGDVVAPELIGNIRSTNITRVSLGLGYPFKIVKDFEFLPVVHYGYVKLKHSIDGERTGGGFRDDGFFIGLQLRLQYRILDWLDLMASVQNNFDFIQIDAPPQDESFFNGGSVLVPSLGLRMRLARSPREDGKKGDGIFTRRDGL